MLSRKRVVVKPLLQEALPKAFFERITRVPLGVSRVADGDVVPKRHQDRQAREELAQRRLPPTDVLDGNSGLVQLSKQRLYLLRVTVGQKPRLVIPHGENNPAACALRRLFELHGEQQSSQRLRALV